MSLTTVILTAAVPDELSSASAQAAAVAFAQTFAESVEGAAVIACTVDGASVLPSAADEFRAARDALDALSTGTPKGADVKAAVARLDAAARAYEASLNVPDAAPAPAGADPSTAAEPVNPNAAAAEAATVTALPDEPAPDVAPVAPTA